MIKGFLHELSPKFGNAVNLMEDSMEFINMVYPNTNQFIPIPARRSIGGACAESVTPALNR